MAPYQDLLYVIHPLFFGALLNCQMEILYTHNAKGIWVFRAAQTKQLKCWEYHFSMVIRFFVCLFTLSALKFVCLFVLGGFVFYGKTKVL